MRHDTHIHSHTHAHIHTCGAWIYNFWTMTILPRDLPEYVCLGTYGMGNGAGKGALRELIERSVHNKNIFVGVKMQYAMRLVKPVL